MAFVPLPAPRSTSTSSSSPSPKPSPKQHVAPKSVSQPKKTFVQQAAGPAEVMTVPPPGFWDPSCPMSCVSLVDVSSGSSEYNLVVSEFQKGQIPNVTIISVKRIQNPSQWVLYSSFKYTRSPQANEQWLWHGTTLDSLEAIASQGFDFRLYGTRVGNLYGRGSYFAVSPGLSHPYTAPDKNGVRRMLQVRVSLGEVDPTPGTPTLAKPRPNPSKAPYGEYDSVTDNPINPSMYVTFNTSQSYANYIVSYKV